jgi:hypothetical protein
VYNRRQSDDNRGEGKRTTQQGATSVGTLWKVQAQEDGHRNHRRCAQTLIP